MRLQVFFSRVRALQFICILIAALILIGFAIALMRNSSIFSAALIYVVSLFISYISTLGTYILYIHEKRSMKHCKTVDNIITFVIAALFGYRFTGLFKYSMLAIFLYILLWTAYLNYKSSVFKNAV